jgi:hypothetical protein
VLSHFVTSSQVKERGQQGILFAVDNGEGVHGDQDLVSFAVDANAVVEVFVLVGRKLNENVFSYSRGDHALLMVLYFEVGRGRGEDVETLGCRGVVDQSHFHGVSFTHFETGELHDGGGGTKQTI